MFVIGEYKEDVLIGLFIEITGEINLFYTKEEAYDSLIKASHNVSPDHNVGVLELKSV